MARVDRVSASGAVDSGFDSKLGQTNDLKKLVLTASLLDVQHGEQAGKFACCTIEKGN